MFEEILEIENLEAQKDYAEFNNNNFLGLSAAIQANNEALVQEYTNNLIEGNKMMLHNISRKVFRALGSKMEYDDVFNMCVIEFINAVRKEASKEDAFCFGGRIFSSTENALKESVFNANTTFSMSYQTYKKYKRQAYAAAEENGEFSQEAFDKVNGAKTIEVQAFDDSVDSIMMSASTEEDVVAYESRKQLVSICNQIFNGCILTELEQEILVKVILEEKSFLQASKEVGISDKTAKKVYLKATKKAANAAKRIDPSVRDLLLAS